MSTYPGAAWDCLAGPEVLLGLQSPRPRLTESSCTSGLTALHVAVNMECPEAVLLLLERGADIDAVVSRRGPGVGPRGAWGRGVTLQGAGLAWETARVGGVGLQVPNGIEMPGQAAGILAAG